MEPSQSVSEPDSPHHIPLAVEAELAILQERVGQLDRLASIGQLTAGILHELKNPLSFIGNYARLAIDLMGEVDDIGDRLKDHPEWDELSSLLDMARGNINRIRENSARAERLIQGMLAQARNDGAHFVPTDLNTLLEEFTKLAYQGIRAGDKEFVVSLAFQLDPGVGEVTLAPSEFNRVILNLVLNACYAVNERRKKQPDDYKPVITVASRKEADSIVVTIRDNGEGIPDEVRQKLFTPFFTTKPAGKGTGLGLALSREIINGLHKGSLSVDSVPGQFTAFTINLPLNTVQK
ncbi:sensor histidine kinase [Larkinella arboricola]